MLGFYYLPFLVYLAFVVGVGFWFFVTLCDENRVRKERAKRDAERRARRGSR